MTDPTCCTGADGYCNRCDLLVGLDGLHVTDVEHDRRGGLVVTVESAPTMMGCGVCGGVAHGHGSTLAELVDAPSFGRPVRLRWRKHRWLCPEATCLVGSFVEQDLAVALPGRLLTTRAVRWAIGQLRDEQASIEGLSRQLGTSWKTVWRAIRPVLEAAADDETRFEGVTTLGVDEHIWHHVSPIKRGPKELTGLVDLTRQPHPRTGKLVVKARLLDLVPGRSGTVYKTWLKERGDEFRAGVKIATLDPFQGYKNAIDKQLSDAEVVVDAFHVVKLGSTAVDDVRCRVQQNIHGHRGHKGDPLYGIRHLLRAGAEHLTENDEAGWPQLLPLTGATSKLRSPTSAPSSFARSITNPPWPKAESSPRRSSPRSRHARSPKSAGWETR